LGKDRGPEPEDVAEETAEALQSKGAENVPEENVAVPKVEAAEEVAAEKAGEGQKLAERVAVLSQELEEARAKEAEYLDGWQRARAELSNARKRFQRDQEQAYASASADILTSLLPIVDDFERAAATSPEHLSDRGWVDGVLLIQRKLQALLDQRGVVPIEATGEEFDPAKHQAITHEPSEMVTEGHVIAEVQKGYQMGDRVLRPAMVRVSSGPPEVEAEEKADAEVDREPAK
jgi:molecular chaperone GrpE